MNPVLGFEEPAIPPEFESAFPIQTAPVSGFQLRAQIGLTKREYIAALCLQGLLAADHAFYADNADGVECRSLDARVSVMYADALLSELNKERT